MKIARFILLTVLLYVEHATGQKIFSQADLKGVYKSFDGSGCPSDTRRHDINKKKYFRYLQESDSNSNNLYVGAMNNVYKLDVTTMQCLNYNESKPTNNTIRRCYIQGKGKDVECQNHIRVVMEIGKGLLVCGTGGYSPIRYQLNDQLQINETFNGVAYCPFDPWDNYTAILVTEGNPENQTVPYFGTYTDFIKSSPVFYRPKFPGKSREYSEKTTDREEINWLNSPQFVGSFDDDEKVMFFFRETAVENVGRNVIYSRVGKVCKQDLGGGLTDAATKKEWLSFQKARLICSLPGSNPHYFDDIYDVYQSDDKQYYYALFFKQKEYDEDSVASAVCLYKKSDIETVFSGKFQTESSSGQWFPLTDSQNPNPRLDNCTAHKDNPNIFNKKSSMYQLMAENVKPLYGKPIYHKTGVQFIRIAVSETLTPTNSDETGKNIYLASDEGEIYDIFMKTYESENTFLVENPPTIYRPFTSAKSRDYSVWSMKVLKNDLFFGTDYNVTRFDIDLVCEKIKDINVCIANTRCEWRKCDGEFCVKANSSSSTECSILDWRNITKAGVIASIKDEIQEEKVDELKAVGEGLYFTVPFKTKIFTDDIFWYNSDQCSGINVLEMDPEKYAISFSKDLVIKNLTIDRDHNSLYSVCYKSQQTFKLKGYTISVASVHVGWSEWSQWSTCSVTCDMGLQHRTRTCTNPPQRPEGNHCLGVNSDTQLCMPAPCANGGWSDWTSWSTCSSTCGGGIRSQSRSCSNPHPSPYGQYCVGSNDRVETCARDNCETKHCSSNPCVHGQCYELRHDFLCLCNPGKTGRFCNISTGAFLCSMKPCIEGTCVPGINNYTCRCNQGYRGRNCDIVNATDCYDILHYNIGSTSGVYNVSLWRSELVKEVFCDMDTDKGGWTVFQNRFDGSVNFTRTFKEYIDGFGSYIGEYWLGLKYIEEMTSHGTTKLRIELSGVDNSVAYRVFRNFSLGVNPGYELHINRGTGHEGDLFGIYFNKGLPFSTYDHDNMNGCGKRARGGWWYSNCTNGNLNGEYFQPGSRHGEQGMFYYNFKKTESLKSSRMMFRRMNFW